MFYPIETLILTALTPNASILISTPSVTHVTPIATVAIVTPILALVTPIASTPIMTPIVTLIVTLMVTLVTPMADIVASREILCSCTVRYVCSCVFNRKNARLVNRSYVSESAIKKRMPSSSLILKRLDPNLAELALLAHVNA